MTHYSGMSSYISAHSNDCHYVRSKIIVCNSNYLNNPLPIVGALIKEHPELHMQEDQLEESYFPPLVSAVLSDW